MNRLQQIIIMQPPEWKGSKPQRFSGGKVHIRPENQLNNVLISNSLSHPLGVKTFKPAETPQQQFKPIVRIYPEQYTSQRKEIDLRGKKPLVLPEQPERNRKEKAHIEGGRETSNEIGPKGIRTFEDANQSRENEYKVEARMQAKARVLGLEQQRNNLTVTSLGDKSYKYPEYASSFFKDGGLIAGSTGFKLRPGENSQPDPSKLKSIFTKPMWTEKVKMEEKEEETRVLDSVDEWEKTILKEANPQWNDPDTFFERMEKKQAGQPGGKDAKKGPKK